MKKEIIFPQEGFKITYCKSKAGFSVKPLKKIRFNLERIKNKLKIMMDTPILLVVDREDPLVREEIIIHSYGEIVFKKQEDTDKIAKIAKIIYDAGLEK